jgi:genome maintenance exonuclease 1
MHMKEKQNFNHIPVELTEMNAVTTDEGRKYHTPEGIDLPSITTVLSILSRDSIAKWRKRVGEVEANKISTRAANRGTAVHTVCEKYLDNDADYLDGVMPNNIETFQKIRPILDENINNIHAQEAPLYSNYLGVAGRVDFVAEWQGKLSIIDFKTSRKYKKKQWCHNYFMQESAYAIMWEERTQLPITQLVTLIAVDDRDPIVYIEHRDNWVTPLKSVIAQWNEENTSVKF